MNRYLSLLKKTVDSSKEIISVNKTNFWNLNPYFKNKRIQFPELRIRPFSNLYNRYIDYKLALKERVAYFNSRYNKLLFLSFDPKIKEIIIKFQNLYLNEIKDEKKLLRLLGIICNTAFIGPEYFHLDISNTCNIDCNYCWFYSKHLQNPPSKEWKKHMIKFNIFKNLVNDLAKLEVDTILFSGAGEPLLHPDIINMIKYVKKSNIKLQIFTNGTLLRKEIAETCVDNNVDELFISPSASTHLTYIKVHPKQKKELFYKIEKNIKYLSKLKKDNNKLLPKIFVLFILNKENYKELREMVNWSKKIGGDFVRFQLAHNDDAKIIELNNDERNWVREEIKHVMTLAKELKIVVDDNIFLQLEGAKKSNEWYKEIFKKGCFVGWNFSRLWANGDISFCCIKKKVGKINNKDNFFKLWNSDTYKKYRNAAKLYNPKTNIKLGVDYYLMDKDCQHCGNMEVNERVYNNLLARGLIKYVK